LQKSILGKLFIKCYYKISPLLVKELRNKRKINIQIRNLLDKFIAKIED